MRLSQKAKDDLFIAQGLGAKPYQKDGRILVRTNAPYYKTATYRVLVDATGSTTAAGKHWEDTTGETVMTEGMKGQTFDHRQPTVKRGASETITLRNGQQAVVRSWDGSKYRYTATGNN